MLVFRSWYSYATLNKEKGMFMIELNEYMKQDIFNSRYLFHDTAYEIEKLECRQSTDNENKDNEENW